MKRHWRALLVGVFTALCAATAQADLTRIEQTDNAVSYTGAWQTVHGSSVSGGSVAAANAAGASVTVNFTGTGIRWIGYRCSCTGGRARVYLDGTLQTTVHTFSDTPHPQTAIYRVEGLANAAHVLTIEVTGEHYAGEGTYIAVDAFDIDDGEPSRRIEESDPAVTFTGNWTEIDDPSVSGGSVRATRDVNAAVYVTFEGTGIEWIGYRCPCTGGIAQINLLERGFLAYKHTYSPTHEAQPVIYRIDGLPPGQHRLEIYVTGNSVTSDPGNAWVVVDAFRILDGGTGGGPENVLPTVSMTAPPDRALVTGDVTLEATASDNVGVTKVQFFAQPASGPELLLGEDTTAPYAITRNTNSVPSGSSFTLWARAVDAAGNLAESTRVVATVQHTDRTVPTLAFTAPAANSTVSGTIAVSAHASDDMGIRGVAFYRDRCCQNQLATEDSVAPYASSLNTMAMLDGPHELHARAWDTAGNVSETESITVTVDNSVQPGMLRLDDDDPAIAFAGAWSLQGGTEAYGTPLFHWGSAAMAETAGASATLSFEGTGVRWIGYRCAFFCGDVTVELDGGPPQAVSLRNNADFGEPGNVAQVVYTSPLLANGPHTLRITVANAHPSGQGRVYVDGFEVLTTQ